MSHLLRHLAIYFCLAYAFAGAFLRPVAAQVDNPCALLLQNGLYSEYKIANNGNFSQDFRNYLLTDKFKSDLHNNKWGGSLTVPIHGIPISIGANASDDDYTIFHDKLLQDTNFSVSFSYFQSIVSSIPNVDLARVYSDCVRNMPPMFGFKVDATSGANWASFNISYTPQISTDPMPVVQSFSVKGDAHPKARLVYGRKILNSNLVSCVRNPQKDLVLFLQTNRGSVIYKIPADPARPEISQDAPIGTIDASYLAPDQFYIASGCNNNSPGHIWTSSYSIWSPADGRAVPNSYFQKVVSQDRVPDLRGMFLRGLNVMDSDNQFSLDITKSDPDNRGVGSYQQDQFKTHEHHYGTPDYTVPLNLGDRYGDGLFYHGGQIGADHMTHLDPGVGGPETRPRNIAVYYYIRIN